MALVPGALTVGLAFKSGGFFPGATAVATLVMALLLIGRVLLTERPFAGFSPVLGVAAGALALFAVWLLSSAAWSHSSARAMTEFDRSLLYLLTLVFFGSLPRTARTARWLVIGLAAAAVGVCLAGFITRTMPDVWSAPPKLQRERLNYPIGYWNALGLVASLGMVFCLHLTCSARESRIVRLLAVMGLPLLASTLLFTFSRGPLAVGAVGIVAYLALARPRLAITGLIAAVPPTLIAILTSYNADFAASSGMGLKYRPLTPAELAEAHDVALIVGACAVGALLLRALGMLVLDGALERLRLRPRTKRRIAVAAAGFTTVAVVAGTAVAVHGGWVHTQYERLVHDPVLQTGDQRDRLFNPGLNRTSRWKVALDAFDAEPVKGHGAGTYRLLWERHRPSDETTTDAHSLYFETLGELGVVGFLLLAVALALIAGGLAWRLRAKGRSVYGALLAGVIVWAVHSAIDWDWELPVVTLWVFAAGGLALARTEPAATSGRLGWPVRAAVVFALCLLAITPARLALAEARLGESLRAYRSDRCPDAVRAADRSVAVLPNLPGPYQVQGYCQARGGQPEAAVRSLRAAVDRDPDNWQYHYGLALAQGLAGTDPRREAAKASSLNPRNVSAQRAVKRFDSSRPARWRRGARELGLGITSGRG